MSAQLPRPMVRRVTFTVLGCAGSWSMTPGRASSSYLVRLGAESVLLDLGQGAFAELAARRDPATLGAVLISHLHPDHCVDLVPLRHYLRYGCRPPASVPLHGPRELRDRFDALLGEPGFLSLLPGDPLSPGRIEIGAIAVEVGRVTHQGESYAFRVSNADDPDASGFVYSGDCANAADLLPLVRPGDCLVAEASFAAAEVPADAAHLNAAAAAGVAAAAGAARLVLTHLLDETAGPDAVAAARASFDGDVLLAEPGLTLVA